MGAPETGGQDRRDHCRRAARISRADLLRLEDAEDCRSFLADPCKSFPSTCWRSTAIRRTGCNCHPDTVLWTSRRLARRMGGLGFATQRRAPHCGWQSVRIARAFWSDTQLVCRDGRRN